jgi:hypothetical protein
MKKTFTHERGQALVVIALAIIGLVAITALTIDGGNAYSDRRHAQNAADTAALAAAQSKVRNPGSIGTWKESGRQRAEDNQYADSDYTTGSSSDKVNVEVYSCTEAASSCPAPYAGDNEYIQVIITSIVDTYFAPIVGISTITNKVDAVARASEPVVEEWFDGNALVSLKPNCPSAPPDNKDPFKLGGNANAKVKITGVWVNSNCDDAFIQSGNSSNLNTDTGVCVVGGSEPTTGVIPPPTENCGTQKPENYYQGLNPDPVCQTKGTFTKVGTKEFVASPGYFDNKDFPNVSPAGTLRLQKGIYCIRDGFALNSNWFITTDLDNEFDPNDPNEQDPANWHDANEGVMFVVEKGPVTINGGSKMAVHAITSLDDNFEPNWIGYLFYVKDGSQVTLSGSSGSNYVGTIYAPYSHCIVQGSGGVLSFDTQIICYTQELTGDGNINIQYNEANNGKTITSPGIQLTK